MNALQVETQLFLTILSCRYNNFGWSFSLKVELRDQESRLSSNLTDCIETNKKKQQRFVRQVYRISIDRQPITTEHNWAFVLPSCTSCMDDH